LNEYILTTKVKAETPEEALRYAYLAGIMEAEAMDIHTCAPIRYKKLNNNPTSDWVLVDPRYWMD